MLVQERVEQARAGRRSIHTADMYRKQAGHWLRILEYDAKGGHVPLALSALQPPHGARLADAYISQRRKEGSSESTISKELICMRATLKLARRRGLWRGDPAEVLPSGFAPEYKPRKRFLMP